MNVPSSFCPADSRAGVGRGAEDRPVSPRRVGLFFTPPAAIALLLVLSGCSKPADPVATTPDLPSAQVQVITAELVNQPALSETMGRIRPVQRALLAAKVMGAIEELPVTLGQSVKAGEILARIGAGEISARVLQAQSQLNLARRDLERERDLLTKGASMADTVRGLEDRFAMAEAMVREAEAMLAYTTLRAPFDGVVARKLANAGDLAAPGTPLIEIEGTRGFEVEVALADSLTEKLTPGTPLAVTVPVANVTFTGELAELSSAADPAAHTVLAKITVPPGTAVRSGQFARVQVPGKPVPTLLIPNSAVSAYGQLERVFVASPDGRAVLRLVRTGSQRGNLVEILSGLDNGETVVTAPPDDLREGQRIEVAPASSPALPQASPVVTARREARPTTP